MASMTTRICGGSMKIMKISPVTGKTHTMDLPIDTQERLQAYEAWRNGKGLIQNELHFLTADQREFLITGITPEEWKKTFEELPEYVYQEPPEYNVYQEPVPVELSAPFYVYGLDGGGTAYRMDMRNKCYMLVTDFMVHNLKPAHVLVNVYNANDEYIVGGEVPIKTLLKICNES